MLSRRPLRAFLIPRVMGVLMGVMLLTHRPEPPLSHYVEALWYYDGQQTAHHKERVLPNGRFQIVIDLSDHQRAPEAEHGRRRAAGGANDGMAAAL